MHALLKTLHYTAVPVTNFGAPAGKTNMCCLLLRLLLPMCHNEETNHHKDGVMAQAPRRHVLVEISKLSCLGKERGANVAMGE